MSTSRTTTDHDIIRKWATERDGHPARIADDKREGGLLRIDFNEPEEGLEEISWDEFFRIFEENGLAFLYQEKLDDGSTSRFNKLVSRDSA